MINQLRKKMMMLFMSIISLVIVGIFIATNVIPAFQYREEAKSYLTKAIFIDEANNRMTPRSHTSVQKIGENQNLFVFSNTIEIYLDEGNRMIYYLCDRSDLFPEQFISNTVNYVLSQNKEFGTYQSYYYLYKNNRIYMLDNTMNFEVARNTLFYSFISCILAWIVLYFLSKFTIQRLLKPVEESIQNQQRFISDAGHELKTPISVISTNASVLENEIGRNKWLSYIVKETEQMEYLVKELMTLSQMEDNSKLEIRESFDVSKCILKACLPFESLAFESNMKLDMQIQENIQFIGDSNKFNQLVTIFLSNALKYGKEQGEIRIKLYEQNKKIILSIYNTGQGVSEEEKTKIFERFYRVDKARSRKEGSHGLGLSIAQAIVKSYHGQILVNTKENEWIEFIIQIPAKEKM
ncbi:MAG: HAMP domain-containing sensor histidine kinase [Bacillota bacterium]|nr:HAMP domain-containing sensor histidine kinase [Bacillota bacterium]